jgi:hypothetical protein
VIQLPSLLIIFSEQRPLKFNDHGKKYLPNKNVIKKKTNNHVPSNMCMNTSVQDGAAPHLASLDVLNHKIKLIWD